MHQVFCIRIYFCICPCAHYVCKSACLSLHASYFAMWVYGSPMQVHFHLSIVVHYNRPGYCMVWLCETGCMVGLYKTTTCGQVLQSSRHKLRSTWVKSKWSKHAGVWIRWCEASMLACYKHITPNMQPLLGLQMRLQTHKVLDTATEKERPLVCQDQNWHTFWQ